MPARILGMYALARMEESGSVYGLEVARRIAERTDGAWRPGPGAIYPALRSLVERGWARGERTGRRTIYRITPRGATVLREIRANAHRRAGAPDLSRLWVEVAAAPDPSRFLLLRLRRSAGAIVDHLARADRGPGTAGEGRAARRLRAAALAELARAQRRLSTGARAPTAKLRTPGGL